MTRRRLPSTLLEIACVFGTATIIIGSTWVVLGGAAWLAVWGIEHIARVSVIGFADALIQGLGALVGGVLVVCVVVALLDWLIRAGARAYVRWSA